MLNYSFCKIIKIDKLRKAVCSSDVASTLNCMNTSIYKKKYKY